MQLADEGRAGGLARLGLATGRHEPLGAALPDEQGTPVAVGHDRRTHVDLPGRDGVAHGANTFPGFRMPAGSKTRAMRRWSSH